MKTIFLSLFLISGLSFGQATDPGTGKTSPGPGVTEDHPVRVVVRRLESVSWNPVHAELTWVLSVWDTTVSPDKPTGEERYVIHPDDAVMEFQGQSRGFDSDEAQRVRSLMNLISRYAVESTVWWSRGGGSPTDGKTGPVPNERDRSKPENAPGGSDEKPKPEVKGTPIVLARP